MREKLPEAERAFKGKKFLFASHQADFQKFNTPLIKMLTSAGSVVDYASDGAEEIKGVRNDVKILFAREPRRLIRHTRSFFQVRKLLREETYDIIHTHTATASVVMRLANRSVKNKKHRPLVYTAHHFQFGKGSNKKDWAWLPIEKFLGDFYTDTLVTISEGDYEIAKKFIGRTRNVQISGVGVDIEKFSPKISKSERDKFRRNIFDATKDDFVIGYVAEMIPRKNHIFLLEAFKKALEGNPKIKLVLLGKGKTEPEIRKFVYDNNLEHRVDIIEQKLGDIDKFYESIDLEVSTSRREGLGMHLLEALAVGTPVLASNIEGHNKFLTKHQMFKLRSTPDELADRIEILSKKATTGKKSRGNKEKTRESAMPRKFALEQSLSEMKKVYEDLLDGARN